jgi:hypothetical protein
MPYTTPELTEIMNSEEQTDINKDRLLNNYSGPISDQNLAMGIIGGLAAAAIGALIWAVITVATGWQIGFMAIGVGCLVGIAVKVMGKGVTPVFGVVGAVLSLIGCLAGNYLAMIGFVANELELGYMEVFKMLPFNDAAEIMKEGFSPIDILFYIIAIFQGYKLAFDGLNPVE